MTLIAHIPGIQYDPGRNCVVVAVRVFSTDGRVRTSLMFDVPEAGLDANARTSLRTAIANLVTAETGIACVTSDVKLI